MALQASQEAAGGRYAAADKLLADYTLKYPATGEAAESMYWRAIYKLDPGNQNANAREAGALLDGYLVNGSTPHRAEATVLRRVVTALETRPATAAAPPRVTADAGAAAADKAKDDDIARLKEELARANAELDRIKRRLAQPTKP